MFLYKNPSSNHFICCTKQIFFSLNEESVKLGLYKIISKFIMGIKEIRKNIWKHIQYIFELG